MSIPGITLTMLAVVAGLAVGARNGRAGVVIAALAANWGACSLLSAIDGNVTEWLVLAAVDFVTVIGLVVWYEAKALSSRWPLYVIAIYAMQLVCHVAYAFVSIFKIGSPRAAAYYYFWILTIGAWAQITIVGGGVCGGIVRRAGRSFVGRAPPSGFLPRTDADE